MSRRKTQAGLYLQIPGQGGRSEAPGAWTSVLTRCPMQASLNLASACRTSDAALDGANLAGGAPDSRADAAGSKRGTDCQCILMSTRCEQSKFSLGIAGEQSRDWPLAGRGSGEASRAEKKLAAVLPARHGAVASSVDQPKGFCIMCVEQRKAPTSRRGCLRELWGEMRAECHARCGGDGFLGSKSRLMRCNSGR